jgi:type II secretory pathway pseudopilin PulG
MGIPKKNLCRGNDRGATLVEMIAVLLLIGIVGAVIINRYQDIGGAEESAIADQVKNHIRFAQVMAMKKNNAIWGIKCDGTAYWLFKTDDPDTATEPDANPVLLPGEDALSVSSPNVGAFTLYFDQYGIPHQYDTPASRIKPISTALTVTVGSLNFSISPETGYIQ